MVPYTTTDTDFEGRTVPGRVVANSRSATAITLVWATVRGATAYQVERRAEQPQDIWQSIATVEQGTTYIDTGLEADTTYYYRVAAEIEEVLALPSDVVSATTSIAPPTATSLTVNETGTTIELTWLDVADETGYRIERSLHGTGEWISIGTTGQDVTVYVDDALSPGVNYEYRIVTTNASGESAPSNVVSVKINGPASPSTGESPGSGNGSASIENTTTSPASEETPASEDTPATEETSTEESP
ncbi:MAG: fibronectin type III domain-containing protein [Actinomycetota bacterium]